MSEVDKAIVAPIEQVLGSLPLGEYAAGRAAVCATLAGATLYFVRPRVCFNEDGSARPWILLDQNNPQATIMPWYAVVGLTGIITGIFI